MHMTHTDPEAHRVVSARVELSTDDHQRLATVAAMHERTIAAEVRYAVRQWLDQNTAVEVA